MNVLVIGPASRKEELPVTVQDQITRFDWVEDIQEAAASSGYDACIDLLFQNNGGRLDQLLALKCKLMLINSVIDTTPQNPANVARFNGWATFLQRNVFEVTAVSDELKQLIELLMAAFGKSVMWVPDIAGLVSPRVVASIINEAYFTLEEQVSTKKEIDTAMKLGTSSPYGPFEWSEKIGLRSIHLLLSDLAKTQERYRPASLLTKEALS